MKKIKSFSQKVNNQFFQEFYDEFNFHYQNILAIMVLEIFNLCHIIRSKFQNKNT